MTTRDNTYFDSSAQTFCGVSKKYIELQCKTPAMDKKLIMKTELELKSPDWWHVKRKSKISHAVIKREHNANYLGDKIGRQVFPDEQRVRERDTKKTHRGRLKQYFSNNVPWPIRQRHRPRLYVPVPILRLMRPLWQNEMIAKRSVTRR